MLEAAAPDRVISSSVTPSAVNPNQHVIEDWQLSGRYKRKPITAEEIGYINVYTC